MDNENFGAVVRRLREKKGILLRQIAAELEIDTALISKIERGERKAQKEHIPKLAAILEVAEEELTVLWLSDKIVNLLEEEPAAYKALKKTEKRIKKK